jgi:hypothetical protein
MVVAAFGQHENSQGFEQQKKQYEMVFVQKA